jgi:hypothetical protein
MSLCKKLGCGLQVSDGEHDGKQRLCPPAHPLLSPRDYKINSALKPLIQHWIQTAGKHDRKHDRKNDRKHDRKHDRKQRSNVAQRILYCRVEMIHTDKVNSVLKPGFSAG